MRMPSASGIRAAGFYSGDHGAAEHWTLHTNRFAGEHDITEAASGLLGVGTFEVGKARTAAIRQLVLQAPAPLSPACSATTTRPLPRSPPKLLAPGAAAPLAITNGDEPALPVHEYNTVDYGTSPVPTPVRGGGENRLRGQLRRQRLRPGRGHRHAALEIPPQETMSAPRPRSPTASPMSAVLTDTFTPWSRPLAPWQGDIRRRTGSTLQPSPTASSSTPVTLRDHCSDLRW
jgi:hypothetical protein